ncbi:hypothetical protein JCM10207_002723 [Rhodosporidiobolus poonsookiae]
MLDIVRDSVFGQAVNYLSKGRYLPFADQRPDYVFPARCNLCTREPSTVDATPKDTPALTPVAGSFVEGIPRAEAGEPAEWEKEKDVGAAGTKGATLPCPHANLVTFAPNDPDNPKNWSLGKRLWVTFEINYLAFSVYIGSSIYTSSQPGLMEEFGVSETVAILGLSLFVVGYGVGPMFLSPLQESPRFGRSIIYWITLALYIILQIPILVPPNFGTILAFRFLTGFIGSPSIATGIASLTDVWGPLELPYAVGIWSVAAVCGPILGPVIGGFAAQANGWRWPLYELLWMCGFALLLFTFFLPETYADTILHRRAARLRNMTGNPHLRTEHDLSADADVSLVRVGWNQIIMACKLSIQPAVLYTNIFIGLVYALLYLFFESIPYVFSHLHGFNLGVSALPFLSFFVTGIGTLTVYILYYKWRFNPLQVRSNFSLPPEANLELALWASPWIPISLFVFGWTGNSPDTHWIWPTIGAGLYFPGLFILFQSVLLYLATSYPSVAASIIASNSLVKSAMAAAFPLFGRPFFSNLGVGPACSILGGISILLTIPLFFLYRYGHRMRAMSKYGETNATAEVVEPAALTGTSPV